MRNLPPGVNIKKLINDLRILNWESADILLYYSKIIQNPSYKSSLIKSKKYNDPVTEADLEVNKHIINGINSIYPAINWAILSEENPNLNKIENNTKSDWLWVLDPLDGTKDFIKGTKNYAMHLALNFQNKPFLGFVLLPEKDELWISDGSKVWCENRSRSIKKISLRDKYEFTEMNIVTSMHHSNDNLTRLIDNLKFKKKIIMGSVGCKFASILRGESDIYISMSLPGESTPKDWDLAAPAIILKNAGGAVTNLFNEELKYNNNRNFDQDNIIIATSNNLNHKTICSKVLSHIKSNNIYPLDI